MKKILLLLIAVILSWSVSAQTYNYSYSHDTLGNRTSQVYQGTAGSRLNARGDSVAIPASRILSVEELKKLGIDIEPLNETANVSAGRGSVASVVDSARFVSMRDDPAARQAYLDSIMAVVTAGASDPDDSS